MKNVITFCWLLGMLFLGNLTWGQGQNIAFRVSNDTISSGNTNVGLNTGLNTMLPGRNNSFFGSYSGHDNTAGSDNCFYGHDAGYYNQIGNGNVNVGTRSGYKNISGSGNTYLGNHAGNQVNGYYNTFIGRGAYRTSSRGNRNVAIGANVGEQSNGDENTYIGHSAAYNTEGNRNVFIGFESGYHEQGSDKLCISNDRNGNLIYGDFSTNQVGINTENLGNHTLSVCGSILSTEILVESGWCDYVFHDDYELATLAAEAQHIQEKGHLSGFQSAEEMNGEIQLGDVTKRQQVKLEEMMLHMIAMSERLDKMEAENSQLKAQLNR